MTDDSCRHMREELGSYALGHLAPDEAVALEAHLEGCPSCRAEAASLRALASIMPLADPTRDAAPAPPPGLGEKIEHEVQRERFRARRRRVTRRGAIAGAVAAAVVAAVLVIGPFGGSGDNAQALAFSGGGGDVSISGTLEPGPLGTQIRMEVSGVRSGTLCRVFLASRDGARSFAGTFRYRWERGDSDPQAVLSSGLDLSRVEAVGVRAAGHTFIVPLGGEPVAEATEYQEAT